MFLRRMLALLIPFSLARRIVREGRVIEYFKWFFDKRNRARGGGGGGVAQKCGDLFDT
ncbi:hypothetical protein AGMMS49941_09120 [Deferribacterales bacterium]|nr:hypothetical protein AGMMS49941_09120 [Deferribacterales bacterium]